MSCAHDQLDLLTSQAAASGAPGRTRKIVTGRHALAALGPWIAEAAPQHVPLLVGDAHTLSAASRVRSHLISGGLTPRSLELQPRSGDAHLVCEDQGVDDLTDHLMGHPNLFPVAVGAGTVNDIVKMAAHRAGREYVAVPTAASMNGYTSAIAAILSAGVKRTLPARQPIGVFADVEIIRHAPPRLNRAGFGDLLSKPLSHADWLLSHIVRDVAYDAAAAQLLDDAFTDLLTHAPGVGIGETAAIGALTETILVSGFSMAMAGTSAPASGGEHLISHYWDMEQHCLDQPLQGLHGTQVGIATRLSAMAWERLLTLPAEAIDPEASARRRPDDRWLHGLADHHPNLTPAVVDEVRAQIAQKQKHGAALAAELHRLRDRWDEARARLEAVTMPARPLAEALRQAGCADRASAIGVEGDRLAHTLRVCRHIRSRYVIWDLLDDIDLLDGWASDLAERSEAPLDPDTTPAPPSPIATERP